MSEFYLFPLHLRYVCTKSATGKMLFLASSSQEEKALTFALARSSVRHGLLGKQTDCRTALCKITLSVALLSWHFLIEVILHCILGHDNGMTRKGKSTIKYQVCP